MNKLHSIFFLCIFFIQETAASDFGSNGDITPSDPSTPSTLYEPFQPQFKVKVTEPIKDGEVINYTVQSTRVRS